MTCCINDGDILLPHKVWAIDLNHSSLKFSNIGVIEKNGSAGGGVTSAGSKSKLVLKPVVLPTFMPAAFVAPFDCAS